MDYKTYSWDPARAQSMRKRTAWHQSAACLLGGRGAGFAQPMAVLKALQNAASVSGYNFVAITPTDHMGVLAILTDVSLQSAARTEFDRLFAESCRKVEG